MKIWEKEHLENTYSIAVNRNVFVGIRVKAKRHASEIKHGSNYIACNYEDGSKAVLWADRVVVYPANRFGWLSFELK